MKTILVTVGMLVVSNAFMTYAWYGHLKHMRLQPWLIAALISWFIASAEYLIQVPANRIGHQVLTIGQLKIIQEVIALGIFIPISAFMLDEKPKLGYAMASVCMILAVYFVFRFK
jgi:uncharacterized protein (DUF486 family)